MQSFTATKWNLTNSLRCVVAASAGKGCGWRLETREKDLIWMLFQVLLRQTGWKPCMVGASTSLRSVMDELSFEAGGTLVSMWKRSGDQRPAKSR